MSVTTNQSATLSGSAQPGSTVKANIFSDPVFLGSTIADTNGNWSLTVTIPDLVPGDHHIVWTGIDSAGNPISESYPVTLLASPSAPADLGGEPAELTFPAINAENPPTAPVAGTDNSFPTPVTESPSTPPATQNSSTPPGSQSPVAQIANASAAGQPIPQGTPAASTVGELALTGSTPITLTLAGLACLVTGLFLNRRRKPART